MKSSLRWTRVFVFILVLVLTPLAGMPAYAQQASSSPDGSPESTADIPREAGILIQGADWTALTTAFPAKTRAKNGIAASFTYGAVPAAIEADYTGEHASVQIDPGRPVICVCHISSIPGEPLLVKLHLQKGMRELNGGRLTPFKGKVATASDTDLVPADVSRPESTVWLVQPREALPPGEYALMLGTQNMAIYSFTVSGPPGAPGNIKR